MAEADDGLIAEDRRAALELLRWYVEMGADEAIGEEPVRPFRPAPSGAKRRRVAKPATRRLHGDVGIVAG